MFQASQPTNQPNECDAVDTRADDGKVRPGCISGKRTDVCTIDGEDVATTLYEVAFEDGNVGEHLERHFIFGDFHDGPTPSSGPRLDVGTPVTARFRGGPQRYPGKIAAVNDDGTYDVRSPASIHFFAPPLLRLNRVPGEATDVALLVRSRTTTVGTPSNFFCIREAKYRCVGKIGFPGRPPM